MHKMPEVEESKKNIRYAIIQTLVLTAIILVIIVIVGNVWINTTKAKEIQKIQDSLVQIVSLARNSIDDELAALRSGKISVDEARSKIAEKLRRMTYSDVYGENYVFMVSYDGVILVQPYQPWLENTDQWNMQDTNGLYLIREIVKIKDTPDARGFVTYFYKPPNLENEEEKLSYVIAIPELNCLIGTGKYMRLHYEDQTAVIYRTLLVICLFAFLVLLVTLVPLHRIGKTGEKLEQEIIKRGEAQFHLQESESNLRTVFNSISDAIFIHTEDGLIMEVNDRVGEMFGCKREDIIGQQVSLIANPGEFNEGRLVALWKRIMDGEFFTIDLRARRYDTKEPFYVESAMQRGIWYGKPVILAVVRNAEKRKFYESELIRNQLINEHAEQMAMLGHYSIDLQTQDFKWSKGLYSLFGRDPSLAAPDFDEYYRMVVPGDVERIKQLRLEMYEKNQPYSVEYQVRRSDGEIRDVLAKVDWLTDDRNAKRFLIGSIQDITERKKAILEISEREIKFRSTVQQMSDGLILLDNNGRIIEWNAASEKITELPMKTVIGKPIWEILPLLEVESKNPINIKSMKKEILKAVNTGKSSILKKPIEIAIQTKNGHNRILMQSIFPIQIGSIFRLGIISRDVTEEKSALEKVNHELEKLACLRKVDAAILERTTPEETLKMICEIAVSQLKVDGAIIFTRLSGNETINAFYSSIDTNDHPTIRQLTEIQEEALKLINPLEISKNDIARIGLIKQLDSEKGEILNQEILPLTVNKKIFGYLQVLSRNQIPEDIEWRDYFITLVGQTSLAIESVTLIANEEKAYNELNHAYEATIAGWSKALELRDEETKGHSERVMNLTCRLAKAAGFPREKVTALRRGVLLHDIGKMGIPDRILLKPGPLTDEEWAIMKQHPLMAHNLLATIPYLQDSLDVPYLHHERWNGSGYPKGLIGKDIPLAARIFAIVDVWDALISDRPYRPGWHPDKVRDYLRENSGKLFDPELVDLFLPLVDNFSDVNFDEDDDFLK